MLTRNIPTLITNSKPLNPQEHTDPLQYCVKSTTIVLLNVAIIETYERNSHKISQEKMSACFCQTERMSTCPGEVVGQLWALAALAGNPCLVPSTHVAAYNCQFLHLGGTPGILCLCWLPSTPASCSGHANTLAHTHTCKIKYKHLWKTDYFPFSFFSGCHGVWSWARCAHAIPHVPVKMLFRSPVSFTS